MTYAKVKRTKRGQSWPDGHLRYCTRCGVEGRARRRKAVVTALLVGSKFKVPVGYCDQHTPEALR